jgi:uncharacterized protein (TIGR00730 family)
MPHSDRLIKRVVMGYAAHMKRVCVFCGSSPGNQPIFLDTAKRVGTLLAERGLELVYGGAHLGLMGAVADAALAAGGHVIGVIPQSLVDHEIAHTGLPDLRVVATMHERKAMMETLADAFLALPGGMGTLEEVCEIYTWGQLGLHRKPCGLLNVTGYYAPFLQLLDNAVACGFLRAPHRAMVLVDSDAAVLLDRFADYHAPPVPKWIERDQT